MPILFGVGLHIVIAICFAVHALRTRREIYWLFVLFSFPLLGSVVYFLAVFLPQSRLEHGLRKAGAAVSKGIDPGREMRAAQAAFDLTPTAHNQMRLARALFEAGKVEQAVRQYDACLSGPFANDAEICLAAAQAKLANMQGADALILIDAVRARSPTFRPEQLALLRAKCLASAARQREAGQEFADLVTRFSSIEVRAEYVLWALAQGEEELAAGQLKELDHSRKHMSGHTRSLHQDLFKRLDAARARVA